MFLQDIFQPEGQTVFPDAVSYNTEFTKNWDLFTEINNGVVGESHYNYVTMDDNNLSKLTNDKPVIFQDINDPNFNNLKNESHGNISNYGNIISPLEISNSDFGYSTNTPTFPIALENRPNSYTGQFDSVSDTSPFSTNDDEVFKTVPISLSNTININNFIPDNQQLVGKIGSHNSTNSFLSVNDDFDHNDYNAFTPNTYNRTLEDSFDEVPSSDSMSYHSLNEQPIESHPIQIKSAGQIRFNSIPDLTQNKLSKRKSKRKSSATSTDENINNDNLQQQQQQQQQLQQQQHQHHQPQQQPRKTSDSRLSAHGLAEVLNLNSPEEALRRERNILEIFEKELHYPLGYKTWVRDTTKEFRSQLINKLHNRVQEKFPSYNYDTSTLETIIRRATYYMMQSRLRRERRARSKSMKSAYRTASTKI